MAQLTVQEYINKLDRIIKEVESNRPLEMAIATTISEYGERIFEKGLNSDGMQIGTYSTKPIYISNEAAPKEVNHRGKTGKKIKGGYYQGGYRQFRQEMGREANFVNLRLNNELQLDVLNNRGDVKTFKRGKRYIIDVKKDINAKKVEGIEKKYGNVFDLTESEKQTLKDTYEFEIEKLFD